MNMATSGSTKPPSRVSAAWDGAMRFDAGRPEGPTVRLDGDAARGPTPPDTLLAALASCAGIDVVDILAKRRTPADAVRVEVTGTRRDDPPRRFTRIELDFDVRGAAVERVHAERAVLLSFEKYCSVAASLAPDIEVWARVTLNGEPGELRRQPAWKGDG